MLAGAELKWCANEWAAEPGPFLFEKAFPETGAIAARAAIIGCPRYAPTPLRRFEPLEADLQVARVFYKDEADRFGLGSFKALGGAYAVGERLRHVLYDRLGRWVDFSSLASGHHLEQTVDLAVCCASDGNHGRAVAAGAGVFGCACVIFLHEGVSAGREAAIRALGAHVVRTPGDYDASVAAAAAAAKAQGWLLISDTATSTSEAELLTPRLVTQGYRVLTAEVLAQLEQMAEAAPTHVFLQAGVGGLAAAVIIDLWARLGAAAPRFIIVEPERADCVFQSILAGTPSPAVGDLDTVMAGLSCGEVSQLAWPVIKARATGFVAIADRLAIEAMRGLATGALSGAPVVAGESAVAGLAGLRAVAQSPSARRAFGLDASARVLLIGTEGATDPDIYQTIVGATPEAVA